MNRTNISWAAAALVSVLLYLILWPSPAGSPEEREALRQGRTIVVYWDRHSGHEHQARVDLVEEYNRSRGIEDGAYVRALPIGYNVLMEKMLTSIAAGSPPDVCSMDTAILAQLVSQGCFSPLDDLVNSEPSLRQEAFLPHTWEMSCFKGYDAATRKWVTAVWGIPTTSDSFCLLWNKDAFRKAGLDPERPPRTIAELEEFAAKLTIRGSTGIEQYGFVPWFPWDLTHMWGGLFGGRWFDEETGLAVCRGDPGVIASFAWQQKFAVDPNAASQLPYAIDPERTQSFEKMGAYQSSNNPFYSGKVAMITEGEWQVTFIRKYAPDLDWGVAPVPQPEGVEPLAYGPASVADAIPAGARNRDAALKFLRWFYAPRPDGRPSPASDYNAAIHNIPPRRDEALQERFMGDPEFRVFVEVLLNRPVVRYPVSSETQFFLDEMASSREYILRYLKTPEVAARDLEQSTNEAIKRHQDVGGASAS
ncbi:MAG: extracellular solute-binding protein [Candidatus Hydrogenedentes bacterium]|nr:extracellular solute-binding protein [Candidatus Hydrogenedentota bacterium]